MTSPELPTPWQRKMIWASLTSLAIAAIGAVAVGLVWVASRVLGFLQPILIPFAVAGVLAYLLDPLVSKLVSWGTSRNRAVLAVFAVVSIALAGILFWIVPAISQQTSFLAKRVPEYSQKVKVIIVNFVQNIEQKIGAKKFSEPSPSTEDQSPAGSDGNGATPAPATTDTVKEAETPPAPAPAADPVATDKAPDTAPAKPNAAPASGPDSYNFQQLMSGDVGGWFKSVLPTVIRNIWTFITSSVGGFLGVFGFLLSLVIVPVYLYYFLIESRSIAESWGDYLPLRASAFKDEVISVLNEINGYLIAFFRGQLVVSVINGTATGILLVFVGLDFGLLVGLLLCVLGLIPYLGIVLCWIPAVIIAAVQGGSWLIPAQPWWVMPLVVSAIFVVWQQIDGLFITPKVVGESVGLHPMSVIASVFIWSLLMGGLLGAILAVPLTATLKVLLKRYIWERKIMAEPAPQTQAVLLPTHDVVTGK